MRWHAHTCHGSFRNKPNPLKKQIIHIHILMKLLRFLVLLPLAVLPACAPSIRDSAAGISPAEMEALKKSYYWEEQLAPPTFGPRELEKRMDRSADPMLDGEYAEGQTTALAVALTSVGDDTFATVLATRSPEVQASVTRSLLRCLWTDYKLHYPKTQAIAASIPQAQPHAR
jgi:hypothetical protein